MRAPSDRPRRLIVVSTLGIAQILAWGSTYYLTAVLAKPASDATGWPLKFVVGAFSLGLLISGLVSPAVGRLIDRHGGRPILAASAVLLAAGLLILGLAPTLPVFAAGWAVLGLGMGAGLYDPAFSTLGRLYGDNARAAITQLTLFGGFASTVCWPLSALLIAHAGWRGACLAYAAIALLVILPLYWFGLPREPRHRPAPNAPARLPVPPPTDNAARKRRPALILFAAIMTIASVITTILAVHLITLLQARGLDLATAVAFGAMLGPSQVAARVLEATFGRALHPIWTLTVSTLGVTAGLFMLVGDPAIIAVGLVLYGAGSGLRSIARGTVPLALFGRAGYATLMGRLALPSLVAQAAAPALGEILLQHLGPIGIMAVLCAAAAITVALTLALLVAARRIAP
jgi:predicted MFS family arabinose efflux permease